MKKLKILFCSLLISMMCVFNSFADLVGFPHVDNPKSGLNNIGGIEGIVIVIAIILIVLAIVVIVVLIKRKNKKDGSDSDSTQTHQNG